MKFLTFLSTSYTIISLTSAQTPQINTKTLETLPTLPTTTFSTIYYQNTSSTYHLLPTGNFHQNSTFDRTRIFGCHYSLGRNNNTNYRPHFRGSTGYFNHHYSSSPWSNNTSSLSSMENNGFIGFIVSTTTPTPTPTATSYRGFIGVTTPTPTPTSTGTATAIGEKTSYLTIFTTEIESMPTESSSGSGQDPAMSMTGPKVCGAICG